MSGVLTSRISIHSVRRTPLSSRLKPNTPQCCLAGNRCQVPDKWAQAFNAGMLSAGAATAGPHAPSPCFTNMAYNRDIRSHSDMKMQRGSSVSRSLNSVAMLFRAWNTHESQTTARSGVPKPNNRHFCFQTVTLWRTPTIDSYPAGVRTLTQPITNTGIPWLPQEPASGSNTHGRRVCPHALQVRTLFCVLKHIEGFADSMFCPCPCLSPLPQYPCLVCVVHMRQHRHLIRINLPIWCGMP
jgi:hypothetical protein